MKKLSVVLATINEEKNIGRCLRSVKDIAYEMIVFDESSTDKTAEIAKKLGAKVYETKHEDNFHITKQKAIDKASGDWILQLDADESVTPELAKEIVEVINDKNENLLKRVLEKGTLSEKIEFFMHYPRCKDKLKLFRRHQMLIEKRDGKLGIRNGEVVAFFVPRVNIFLGKPLIHGGVYPDGVIRLIKKGKARLPGKSVHEVMEIDGEVGWLFNDLEHHDSPTLKRYLARNNRYTDLFAKDYEREKLAINTWTFYLYVIHKPIVEFLSLYFRHKAVLDGIRGFIWSIFSALRFPISYFKYLIYQKDKI